MANVTRSLEMETKPEKIRFRRQQDPMDIKVFEPDRQPRGIPKKPGVASCEDGKNGGCSHLCLASSTSPAGYSCACPTGIKRINNLTCADEFEDILVCQLAVMLRPNPSI